MSLRTNRKALGLIAGAVAVALLGFVLGGLVVNRAAGPSADTMSSERAALDSTAGQATSDSYAGVPMGAPESMDAAKVGGGEAGVDPSANADRMIIRSASIDLRVKAIEKAVAEVKAAARKNGAEVTELSVTGGQSDVRPMPLQSPEMAYPSPANAYAVLRVPAEKLDALERDVAKAGVVLSQTGGSSDVTEQYVDLKARLKNLQAEEARLRVLFKRAVKVDDLLAVERELARVRGEIESMQAQITMLGRQVAKATLTVSMTEPAPVVQPSGQGWGFLDAVRRGIQGAVALVTGALTVLIALSPLIALAIAGWLIWRVISRRRRAGSAVAEQSDANDTSTED